MEALRGEGEEFLQGLQERCEEKLRESQHSGAGRVAHQAALLHPAEAAEARRFPWTRSTICWRSA